MRTVITTRVAGFNHHPGASATLALVHSGEVITLAPEPTNRFDPHAVRVIGRGRMLGYVPKDISKRVAALIADRDVHVRAFKDAGTFNSFTIEAVSGDPL